MIPADTCFVLADNVEVFLIKVCILMLPLCVYTCVLGLCFLECEVNCVVNCVFFPQGYVVCPSEKRFLLLFTFLKKNRKKKLMVFFSSCMSVKYHYELLNYIDLPVMAIHVSRFADLVHIKVAHKALIYTFIKSNLELRRNITM